MDEKYKYCEENTCFNLNNPWATKNCTATGDPGICKCKPPYYRSDSNKCVRAHECKKKAELHTLLKCPGKNERLYGFWCPYPAKLCPGKDFVFCRF